MWINEQTMTPTTFTSFPCIPKMEKAILSVILASYCFHLLASGQLTYPPEVDALNAIRHKLRDPGKNLRNWKKGDPCLSSWTGVICSTIQDDGYLHVQELRMLNLNLSGNLPPELGQLSNLTTLNFMWNNFTGSIPKEIGNLKSLQFLLLSGNQLSGPFADELGYLPRLLIFQVDWNQISGPLPPSFANLISCGHFHMNNNSISGQIPIELSTMPQLQHLLLDNNNLSGYLPPQFSQMPNLKIIQLDNNNFGGTQIPPSYGNISTLVKLSLRNCNLEGVIPDFSSIEPLRYLDLSHNQLNGEIPTNKLSDNMTAIDLSYNLLNGSIPSNLSGLPQLQKLSLESNLLSGDVPSNIMQVIIATIIIDFRNNSLSNISGSINSPANVTVRLEGNPVCTLANQLNIAPFCGNTSGDDFVSGSSSNSNGRCKPQWCPLSDGYEFVPGTDCFCAAPLGVELRLTSPSFIDFRPNNYLYRVYITSSFGLDLHQLIVQSFIWEKGPRLRLFLKFFPQYVNYTARFNESEVNRIIGMLATFSFPPNDTFAPYELIKVVPGLYSNGQLTYPLEVDALNAIRRKLHDPGKNLRNWTKGDPCLSSWTGVICSTIRDDGYLHVKELRMLNLNLSGNLPPELGQLSNLTTLNFMWNNLTGSIPKEIGNLKSLQFLLLSGNLLSGPFAVELGYLPRLLIFQVDWNQISGPLPPSFANLISCSHFHMNNNSISGQIPTEISRMPQLQHFLLDNNNLSGYLPPQFSQMPNLKIIQLDNNNFGGTQIPPSYGNMSKLVKLSLRNCNLEGAIPDLSSIAPLHYIDLSHNQLTGEIPTNKLSEYVTTIDLSYNLLNGSIPSNFSGLPQLQKLSLESNLLSGDVPSNIWQNLNFTATIIIDFRNNSLSNISGSINPPANVTVRLEGNPVCTLANQLNIAPLCGNTSGDDDFVSWSSSNSNGSCKPQWCPLSDGYEFVPGTDCFCAAPLGVELRLITPSFIDFRPNNYSYRVYITSSFGLDLHQLIVQSFIWEKGPRLWLFLNFFPQYVNYSARFNDSELNRIIGTLAIFSFPPSDTFGPYELIKSSSSFQEHFISLVKINLKILHIAVVLQHSNSGTNKAALIGIILGSISLVVAISVAIMVLYKRRTKSGHEVLKKQSTVKVPIRTENVKEFSFVELEEATNGFKDTSQVGQGGYGKVYKGFLANGTVVAIKRARQGSLQNQSEFTTEIELLSRLHHRNLVSLVGYCSEQDEQMLVYEFMPNGSLHDLLSDRYRHTLSFPMRLRIALGSAKGILYLHTEADPPIFHRDIKATNILLDFKFTPKVSDFGISRLAPVPDAEGDSAHVSTAVKGTPGYLDPEYFLTHKLTEKSDVYSLGIVFLELLTGMLPISHGKNIVREVSGACESGSMFSIIDQSMGSYSCEYIKKFMALALKCCQDDPKERPTMLEVVRELENLCSLIPEYPTESDASISGVSGVESSPIYPGRDSNSQTAIEISGSELVSGAIPSIKPR
ncbi:hypothetical protein DITRI_Ditri15bG0002400 [Diplodiscus trichospermus]